MIRGYYDSLVWQMDIQYTSIMTRGIRIQDSHLMRTDPDLRKGWVFSTGRCQIRLQLAFSGDMKQTIAVFV